jgi:predicted Zn-dependent protease
LYINRGSGWAADVAPQLGQLDFIGCTRRAGEKARLSRGPRRLQPGKYVTILEPACVADLLWWLASFFDARSADEGRSCFSAPQKTNRLGEQLFSPAVTIYSDPGEVECPALPWTAEGLAQQRCHWVEKGRLKNLSYSRFWAQKQGVAALGAPSNLLLSGGNKELAELIASTEKGILISSFWYIRLVDPQSLLLTGLTRDGVFWLEDGRIDHPVNNFRWNESPLRLLKNIEAMNRSNRVAPRDAGTEATVVPALKLSSFELSSISEAI